MATHHGHLAVGSQVIRQANLKLVGFLPAGTIPSHLMLVISLPFGRQHRMLLQRGSREHVRL